jgi:hypothetical protein
MCSSGKVEGGHVAETERREFGVSGVDVYPWMSTNITHFKYTGKVPHKFFLLHRTNILHTTTHPNSWSLFAVMCTDVRLCALTFPTDVKVALGGFVDRANDVQERGFAAAGFPQNTYELAALQDARTKCGTEA